MKWEVKRQWCSHLSQQMTLQWHLTSSGMRLERSIGVTQETSAVDFRQDVNQTLSSWARYYVSGNEQRLWFTMWAVCVALKEDLSQSVICYCKHSLAQNTLPHYKGCIRNLGSNPKGLTILHFHIIDTEGFMEWTWNMYDSMKKDGVRHQSRQS